MTFQFPGERKRMGQAITTLFRNLLDRVGGQTLFDRYWKALQAILTLLRRWLAGNPPSTKAKLLPSCPRDDDTDPVVKYAVSSVDDCSGSAAVNHTDHRCTDIRIKTDIPESASVSDVTTIGSVDEDESRSLGAAEEQVQPRWMGPYSGENRILLVGEGDFSFAASLAVAFGDASNMIATSLDSFEYLMENYKRGENNISELTSRGCKVIHGVDATSMVINLPQLRYFKFHYIVFNFPRVNFSNPKPPREAQISKHQELIRGFLANAKQMMHGDGQIHITHQCSGGTNLDWNIEMLGSSEGLRLVEESPFNSREYPGYCAKYGCGGDASFGCNPAITYKFQLVAPSKKKRTRRNKKLLQTQIDV